MVECSIKDVPQPFVVDVRDDWAPHGAARFVELVQDKALDGSAFHRAGPGFLTQFGISPDLALREKWTDQTIPDPTTTTSQRKMQNKNTHHTEIKLLGFLGLQFLLCI